jgi:casein kinase 1
MSDLLIIKNKYRILEKIGQGKFGAVYKGESIRSSENVAIKFEHPTTQIKILKTETTILNYLFKNGCRYIPLVHWFGIFMDRPTLVMTYYNESLDKYLISNKNISIEKITKIFQVILMILKSIHDQYVIHRDIKPQNFMVKNNDIFLIDFGMATMYIDSEKNHIPEKYERMEIIGTPKFISLNIHSGWEPTRRDDVMSACYIFLFMHLGKLPWDSVSEQHISVMHPSNQKRLELKSWDQIENILENIDAPISSFIKKTYGLNYSDEPDYEVD